MTDIAQREKSIEKQVEIEKLLDHTCEEMGGDMTALEAINHWLKTRMGEGWEVQEGQA